MGFRRGSVPDSSPRDHVPVRTVCPLKRTPETKSVHLVQDFDETSTTRKKGEEVTGGGVEESIHSLVRRRTCKDEKDTREDRKKVIYGTYSLGWHDGRKTS